MPVSYTSIKFISLQSNLISGAKKIPVKQEKLYKSQKVISVSQGRRMWRGEQIEMEIKPSQLRHSGRDEQCSERERCAISLVNLVLYIFLFQNVIL